MDNRRWSSYREYRNIDEYRYVYRYITTYNSRAMKAESCETGLIELEIATLNTTKSQSQSIPLASDNRLMIPRARIDHGNAICLIN